MKFEQHQDGSCDIKFSWREVWIILKKRKLHLSAEALRHFGNFLVKIVSDWNLKFNEDLRNKSSTIKSKIEGE